MVESILEQAILEMGRLSQGESFAPSDVVKWIYPTSWEYFTEDVEEVMMELYREGKIAVTQNNKEIPKDGLPQGLVRITLAAKTKSV
jgi:hypothetical protein